MRFIQAFVGAILSLSSLRLASSLPQAQTESTELTLGSAWLSPLELVVTPVNFSTWDMNSAQCTAQPFPQVPSTECITGGITAIQNWLNNVTGLPAYLQNSKLFKPDTILTQNIRGETTNVLIYWYPAKYMLLEPLVTPLQITTNTIHYLQPSLYPTACVYIPLSQTSVFLTFEKNAVFVSPFEPPPPPPETLPPAPADPTNDPFAAMFLTCKQ